MCSKNYEGNMLVSSQVSRSYLNWKIHLTSYTNLEEKSLPYFEETINVLNSLSLQYYFTVPSKNSTLYAPLNSAQNVCDSSYFWVL